VPYRNEMDVSAISWQFYWWRKPEKTADLARHWQSLSHKCCIKYTETFPKNVLSECNKHSLFSEFQTNIPHIPTILSRHELAHWSSVHFRILNSQVQIHKCKSWKKRKMKYFIAISILLSNFSDSLISNPFN
jgi:hypothetical protein